MTVPLPRFGGSGNGRTDARLKSGGQAERLRFADSFLDPPGVHEPARSPEDGDGLPTQPASERPPVAFDAIGREVLPQLVRDRGDGGHRHAQRHLRL